MRKDWQPDDKLPDECVRIAAAHLDRGDRPMFGTLTLERSRWGGRPRCCAPDAVRALFGPLWGPAVWGHRVQPAFIVAIVAPLMLAFAY